MANELIINASLPETRIALMEDGEIQELLIERASGKGIVGNIYKGRVTRVLPGMQAAFVDIGLEKAAFLYVDDVFVHSEIWEKEEGPQKGRHPAIPTPISDTPEKAKPLAEGDLSASSGILASEPSTSEISSAPNDATIHPSSPSSIPAVLDAEGSSSGHLSADDLPEDLDSENFLAQDEDHPVLSGAASSDTVHETVLDESIPSEDEDEDEEEDEDHDRKPVKMGPESDSREKDPEGTVSPSDQSDSVELAKENSNSNEDDDNRGNLVFSQAENQSSDVDGNRTQESSSVASSDSEAKDGEEGDDEAGAAGRRRHRRGRRGGIGKFRSRKKSSGSSEKSASAVKGTEKTKIQSRYPESYQEHLSDSGNLESDRAALTSTESESFEKASATPSDLPKAEAGRPVQSEGEGSSEKRTTTQSSDGSEFRAQRSRDRRIRPKVVAARSFSSQVNIQDLLKEGQEVLVQVAKDPIATKGARLTCHISLPGRHLVCMPTIDHVGVSRRIEREDERRRLREFVERNRPRNLGFIVRTASGKQQSEKRIKQDIDYLTRLWTEIREKASNATAPAMVYEDLNSVLRAVRDWVTEETDKIIVDSRYHYGEIQRFVSHFMPSLKQKVELYHGDIPIFDAYGISTELSRALERKVWLKSGGYIVIDQAEALVAIDVNTGRYVGKKNLEDTILKTNLEAVQEIAYQLRLRNCGGIIILDLIDMEKPENKQRVYRALDEALMRDRARPTILKISELGLVEMTRKRTRDTIVRALCESCSHCEGKGFIKSRQTVAYEAMREVEREGIERDVNKILVQAHPEVIDILAIDERETLDQMERRYKKSIYLQAVSNFHLEQFEVTADKKEKSDQERVRHSVNREERNSSSANVSSSGGGSGERSHRHRDRDRDRDRGTKERDKDRGREHHSDKEKEKVKPHSHSRGVTPKATIIQPQPVEPASSPTPASTADSQVNAPEPGNSLAGVEPQVSSGLANGNVAPAEQKAGSTGEKGKPENMSLRLADPTEDGFSDEEDRLAFLRAQAAQDAALARLNAGLGAHSSTRGNSDLTNRNDRGGKHRNMRNRRGGKFRSRNERGMTRDRDRDRNGKAFIPVQGDSSENAPRVIAPTASSAPSLPKPAPAAGPVAGSGSNDMGTGGN